MSFFEAMLLGALKDALEGVADGQRGSSTATVSRTDRYVFHDKHSDLVSLSADKRTATRQALCFDQGIVFSDQVLRDNEVFEIRIDQIMPLWDGTLDIGVTSLNPMVINLPKTMTDLTVGTWMLSGNQVVQNRRIMKRGYGQNLNSLSVGDRVGVARADDGTLHFFINGKHQGVAAGGVPQGVYAVVDIYGKCVRVSISSPGVPSSPSSLPSPKAPTTHLSSDEELERYKKQRQYIQECTTCPYSLWLLNKILTASSDDEKREIYLFINAFGHRLNQDTVTCDGCQSKVPVISHRYRCMQCEDLDLCESCFKRKSIPKDHELNHKVAEMRYRCDGKNCGGYITGTRFHCLVCEDFDLCLGCQKTKNWPLRHNAGHSMTKESTLIVQAGDARDGIKAADDGFCRPGQHNFSIGQCIVCKSCRECTGYGANCINHNMSGRIPGRLCGCGYGDAGCTKCQICKRCATKKRASTSNPNPENSRPASARSKECEYRKKCERFVQSLKISDEYFDKTPTFNKCFCEDCHKARGDKECYARGKPAKTYALPVGWSRFSIKVGPQAKVLKIFEQWHVAFHGTQATSIRPILNTGAQLLMAGDVAFGGAKLFEGKGHYNENWKPEGFDTKKVFVSPSIKYSGCPVYAKKQSFTDPVTNKTVSAQVALQVLIRPGSYHIGKCTVERAQPFDSNFSDDELEWSTKERGAIIVTGLLVKIQE